MRRRKKKKHTTKQHRRGIRRAEIGIDREKLKEKKGLYRR